MKKFLLYLSCLAVVSEVLHATGYENRVSTVIDFNSERHICNGPNDEVKIRNFEDLTDYALFLKNQQLGKKNMPFFMYGSNGQDGTSMKLVQDENDFLRALSCGGVFMLTKERIKNEAPQETARIGRSRSAESGGYVPRRLFPVSEAMPALEYDPEYDPVVADMD
jgi:hypothetical protein